MGRCSGGRQGPVARALTSTRFRLVMLGGIESPTYGSRNLGPYGWMRVHGRDEFTQLLAMIVNAGGALEAKQSDGSDA